MCIEVELHGSDLEVGIRAVGLAGLPARWFVCCHLGRGEVGRCKNLSSSLGLG